MRQVVIGVGIDTAKLERAWESMCAAVKTHSSGSDSAASARRAAALADLVEDDHRFFGAVERTTAVSFGLCGNVGLAFVERERRSELNRELVERYGRRLCPFASCALTADACVAAST